jgi:hypothetical protein
MRIFPEAAGNNAGGKVYIILTFQPSKVDLVDWSDEAAVEKDLLLENARAPHQSLLTLRDSPSQSRLCFFQFVTWGKSVCQLLRRDGYWADLSDPCSGYPVRDIYPVSRCT